MQKNPTDMSIMELKALLFDLEQNKQALFQILNKKLTEPAETPSEK